MNNNAILQTCTHRIKQKLRETYAQKAIHLLYTHMYTYISIKWNGINI